MMDAATTQQAHEQTTASGPSPRGLALWLFEPVPIGPLVQFRIALGLILLWEASRYLIGGWPRAFYLDPPLLFHYDGFEWVRPLPERLHLAVVPALALATGLLTCGLFYRLAAAVLFVGWGYLFLLDQALYLNHLYLVILITGLSILLPANRAFSLDVLMRPRTRRKTAHRWTLALLRFQIGLVYFFAGVAKLNPDWLSGIPMQEMLLERADLIGQPAGEPAVALFFAWSGLLLDLFIVPLLCWKRTRIHGLLLIAGFHLTNHVLFRIGIFPWFMLAATLILWPPYPLSLLSFGRIYGTLVAIGMLLSIMTGGFVPYLGLGLALVAAVLLVVPPRWLRELELASVDAPETPPPSATRRFCVVTFLALYGSWQILMPLRHFAYDLYDGRYSDDVSWTEQGHKWSWHMKLRIKRPWSAVFFVLDNDRRVIAMIDAFDPNSPLTPEQFRAMTVRPELILQFAHYLRNWYEAQLGTPVEVTAAVQVELNGRQPQDLIDPEANLATIESRMWPPAEWILPLDAPRRPLERIDVAKYLKRQREPIGDEAVE